MEIKICEGKFIIGEFSITGNYCDGYTVKKINDDKNLNTLYNSISLESCLVWCLNAHKEVL